MNYPENLKVGDTIGICAPSCGITEPEKIEKYEKAIANLKNIGYKIIETESVRKQENGRASSAKQRAKEFMELLENDEIKLIIFASGGDFLCEMIDYLDFEKIKTLKPKWMQGFSDITGISYLFNTILEIPSIYCQNIKDYAMQPLFRNLIDAFEIEKGNSIIQNSFELYEKEWSEDIPNYEYNLTEKVKWKNLVGGNRIQVQGRALGGCLDCILNYVGTKYDKTKEYIKNHKEEGIIWFFDCFEFSTPALFRGLWQMKNAGYFENCKAVIFGRPLFIREDYEITFNDAIKQAIGNINIPIIVDADIGHVAPQLAVVNGGYIKITLENGKGKIENIAGK